MSSHYDLRISRKIFRGWCELQFIEEEILVDLIQLLITGGPRVLFFYSCDGDASDYIFRDLKHRFGDIVFLRGECGSDSIGSEHSTIAFHTGLADFKPTDCMYNVIALHQLPSFDYNLPLHPQLWTKLLDSTVRCYGCSVEHPSQLQHMGIGGCLADSSSSL